ATGARARTARYCRVSARVVVGNGIGQLAEVTLMGPVMVEAAPTMTVMVPASWPVQAGCAGMPPGATEIVYGSDDPVSVPVRNPFNRTVPLGRLSSTGPETDVSACVRVHLMRAA